MRARTRAWVRVRMRTRGDLFAHIPARTDGRVCAFVDHLVRAALCRRPCLPVDRGKRCRAKLPATLKLNLTKVTHFFLTGLHRTATLEPDPARLSFDLVQVPLGTDLGCVPSEPKHTAKPQHL